MKFSVIGFMNKAWIRSMVRLVGVALLLGTGRLVRGVDPPRLSIEPPGKLTLGALGPEECRLQRYTFTNHSGTPISLRVFDLAPGLRVGGPALERPIPPRGTAGLDLRVEGSGWTGFQVRNVRLGTDDPRQGTYFLPMELWVRPDLTVDRPRRTFGDVAVPGSPQETFMFIRETGAPVVLKVTQPLPPYLEVEQGQGKGTASLTFTLRTDRVPPGVRLGFESIRVATNAPLQPQFDLYLGWQIHHAIEASPSRLVFQKPEDRTLPLALAGPRGHPFRLLAARVEGAGFRVGPPAPGLVSRQDLTIVRTADRPARAMLVLTFEDEDLPLKVPLAYLP